MVRFKIKNKQKKQNFTLRVLMQVPNYLHTGLQKITERVMEFMQAMEFYSITNLLEEVKPLSLEK